ncbi:hypothetical protein [Streptomyces sp. NRRL F-5123]|uniref:hypothetical protein n=1 Tax=Streptomyces sp. NRRL F-5123 TaxID=1463856 RepID=UPI000A4429C4|nr:hypothetical protein [Streptomyces sp. NRRL F-5123]
MKRTETPAPEPTPGPQPNVVSAEPATVEACANDYQQRNDEHAGGHSSASPHTFHRR